MARPGGRETARTAGTVAASQTVPAPLRTALPPGTPDGSNALGWTLPFATPIAALHLQAMHNNSLVPVRILGQFEAGKGMALPDGGLQATVEFALLQVAFLASGTGRFTLAVGRAQTVAAAVDASLLGSVTPARLAELPLATLSNIVAQAQPSGGHGGAASRWLPDGVSLRSVLLWVVMGAAAGGCVLALGAVAYSLLRQLAAKS